MEDIEFDRVDIERALSDYKLEAKLGRGTFGSVYLVCNRHDGSKCALKKVQRHSIEIKCFGLCEYEQKNAVNEVRILASLDHPNIVKFISSLFDSTENDLYIFMEYASGGDLLRLIDEAKNKKKKIAEGLIWKIALDLASGLEYLERNRILHRDIKPANIFKDEHGVYKLGDMNVSKIIVDGEMAKTRAGSPLYVCPEVWNESEEGYNEKCDIWSLGVVLFELCCLRVPYEATSIEELIRKQKSVKLWNIPTGYSASLNELIHEMLQIVPGKRISARKIVEWCEREMKVEIGEKKVGIDPLIDTIVFPESEQRLRWVALPPKFPRKTCNDENNLNKENEKLFDKEKSLKEIGENNENNENSIFNDNASLFVAKSPIIRSQHSFKKIKLPSLRKYYCGNSQDKQDKLREGSERKLKKSNKKSSREKSIGQHKEHGNSREKCGSPAEETLIAIVSERITRKAVAVSRE